MKGHRCGQGQCRCACKDCSPLSQSQIALDQSSHVPTTATELLDITPASLVRSADPIIPSLPVDRAEPTLSPVDAYIETAPILTSGNTS